MVVGKNCVARDARRIAVSGVLAGIASWKWIVSPSATRPELVRPADAVVMFVGGTGERLDTAMALMTSGAAPMLVIPNGRTPSWPAANDLCSGVSDYEVLCQTPTTRAVRRGRLRPWPPLGWTTRIGHE